MATYIWHTLDLPGMLGFGTARDKQRIGEFLSGAPADLKDLGEVVWKHLDRGEVRAMVGGVRNGKARSESRIGATGN